MQYDFYIVDVFSSVPFGGNQLAVLPDAKGLSDEAMQSIAREFNLSETTFVLPPNESGHTAHVRIFTPKVELPFAGHPTIGTAAVLVQAGIAKTKMLALELGVGRVDVQVAHRGSDIESTLILDGAPELRSSEATLEQLAEVLSLERTDLIESFDASAGVPFCFVRLTGTDAVDRARLDGPSWSRHLEQLWAPQIYLFAGDLADGGELYARMFAPGLGVSEDPATGSAAAALIGAAALRQKTTSSALQLFIVQGVAMGRRSEIRASAELDSGEVKSVAVAGFTTAIAHGVIDVPPNLVRA